VGFFRRQHTTAESSSDAWLVVGLGNPGKDYADTRHNIGQMVVEAWAEETRQRMARLKSFGTVAKVSSKPAILVAVTAGYMNVSGPPAAGISRFHGIPAHRLIVIHDDLDLPFGQVRLKLGGGHGGHNGLKSLHTALHTPDFFRVRLGIGRPPGQKDPATYVLDRFDKTQTSELPRFIERAKEATEAIIREGLTAAQQRFHQAS
jgi:peptidyl-tRNA hydrolase, PTH1 family